MIRLQCCAQGHELTWLTTHLAVCSECDVDMFIYHYAGYGERIVRFMDHLVRTSTQATREAQARLTPGSHPGSGPLMR